MLVNSLTVEMATL